MSNNPTITDNKNHLNYSFLFLTAVLFITIFSYFPCIENDFTNWDDDEYIVNSHFLSKDKLPDYFVKDKFIKGNYHPLTMISYSLEYSAVKLKPRLYHWDNLLIHLLNTAFVFWLLLLLTGTPLNAAFAAILFGVHPMHVESVAWVSERKDVLYSFFFLASIISYIFYLRRKKILFYFLCVLLFLLSLLSKGQAVTLPVVLLLVDYFCNRKFNRKMLYEKIPFFILSITFGIIAVYAQSTTRAMNIHHNIGESIIFASYGLLSYFLKLFFPFDLSCFYPYPLKTNGFYPIIFYFAPLVAVGILIFTSWKYHKNKSIVFGTLFFLATIFPLLQLLPVGRCITSDRYSYIPYIGLFFILGQLVNYLSGHSIKEGNFVLENIEQKKTRNDSTKIPNRFAQNKIYILIFISAIAVFVYAGNQRCRVWKNSETLWEAALASNPENPEAYLHLAAFYVTEGKKKKTLGESELASQLFNKAIENFKKCIDFEPENKNAPFSLGLLYNSIGLFKDAKKYFSKAIFVSPLFSEPWSGRSMAELNLGENDNAIRDINRAISISPEKTEYYFVRATALLNKNLFADAISDLKIVIRLDSNHTGANLNLGICFSNMAIFDSAIYFYNKVIEQDPSFVNAFFKRACAYADSKKYNEAIKDFNIILNNLPTDTTSYLLRSRIYLLMNDKKAALDDALKAKKLGMIVDEEYLKKLK